MDRKSIQIDKAEGGFDYHLWDFGNPPAITRKIYPNSDQGKIDMLLDIVMDLMEPEDEVCIRIGDEATGHELIKYNWTK